MTAGYNDAQSVALAVVPKVTGFLSVVFSAVIVFVVARDDNKRNKIYHRLLVGIALTDLTSSFWLALSTWPIPRESTALWASGNEATCKVQGFFAQFGIASSFYNASLSIYFLLVIRYGWKEARLLKIEPFLHSIPLLYGFGSAFSALGLGLFGDAALWCGISQQYDEYRLALFYGPLWTLIILVTISSTLIYLHVSHVEKRTNPYQYDFDAPAKDAANVPSVDVEGSCVTADASSALASCKRKSMLDAVYKSPESADGAAINMEVGGQLESAGPVHSNVEGSCTQATSSASKVVMNSRSPSRRGFVGSLVGRLSSLSIRDVAGAAHRKRSREVASQCFWFAGAFYINWTALSLTRLIQTINGEVYYPLLLIAAFTAPMHGLPNVIVYLGPKIRHLRQDSSISLWQVLRRALARERSSLPVAGSSDDDQHFVGGIEGDIIVQRGMPLRVTACPLNEIDCATDRASR